MYDPVMDVAVSALRADLARWIERVRAGEEVVVTDRGTPVARLLSVDAAPRLERLQQQGLVGRPRGARPRAADSPRVGATGPVADLVGEQRR